jgi:hypothetical protein
LIPSEYDWDFRILETCPEDSRLERERYHYNILKPLVNRNKPGTTEEDQRRYYKDYAEANREKINERARESYRTNPEANRSATQRWRDANRDKVRAIWRACAAKKRETK